MAFVLAQPAIKREGEKGVLECWVHVWLLTTIWDWLEHNTPKVFSYLVEGAASWTEFLLKICPLNSVDRLLVIFHDELKAFYCYISSFYIEDFTHNIRETELETQKILSAAFLLA